MKTRKIDRNKIVAYAITRNGDGYAEEIGRYESIEDIRIRIAMFKEDVVISFGLISKGEFND